MWYPEPLKKGEWIRKAPPKEGQWTREQWETFAQEATKKQPRLWRELAGAGMAGGLAYGLQRMGLSPPPPIWRSGGWVGALRRVR